MQFTIFQLYFIRTEFTETTGQKTPFSIFIVILVRINKKNSSVCESMYMNLGTDIVTPLPWCACYAGKINIQTSLNCLSKFTRSVSLADWARRTALPRFTISNASSILLRYCSSSIIFCCVSNRCSESVEQIPSSDTGSYSLPRKFNNDM